MNNKGFAVSGILYTILLIFLALLMMLLFNFEGKKNILDNIKSELYNDVNDAKYVKYENGTAIYFNPETGNVCSIEAYNNNTNASKTGNKSGCMKWYTFNDSTDNENVNMILDHNTTATIRWSTTSSNTTNADAAISQLNNDTASWKSEFNARLISADEVAEITGANSESTIKWNSSKSFGTIIDNQSSWLYLDGGKNNNKTSYSETDGWQKQYANNTIKSDYAWLYDGTTGCAAYGCNIEDSSNSGYWTSNLIIGTTDSAWIVFKFGRLDGSEVNYNTAYGIRPVITVSKEVLEGELCDASLNQEYTFDYTGSEQEFTVPCNGNYKLETWGAQGGSYNTTYYGGYGAYSTGKVELSKNDELYVVAGGTGAPISGITTGLGGYNGGGGRTGNWTTSTTATQIYGTGGGATHIALSSGLLSTLSSKISDILLVAAGGGGATYMYHPTVAYWYNNGGAGGGISGEKYTVISATSTYKPYLTQNTMSTQTESGTITYYITTTKNGLFGVGGSSITGGGGGFYGGSSHVVGNGGSSYIGNLLLTDKVMYCYSCTESSNETTKTISTTNVSTIPTSNYAKQGNGYAKITYLGN